MKRCTAAIVGFAGLLMLVSDVLAQVPPPLGPPPSPAQIAARRACNAQPAGQARTNCINAACAGVSTPFRGACISGIAMFASAPSVPTNVAQRRACNNVPPANRGACINSACGPVAPQFRQACLAGAGPYAAGPTPPGGPTNVAQRRACNNVPPASRGACINSACGPVAPQFRQACLAGAGPYAAGPTPPGAPTNVAQRRACNNVPPANRQACINSACGPVAPQFRQACLAGAGPYAAGPTPPGGLQQLNTLRSSISSQRSRALALCRQLYDGAQEQACIRGLFPPAPAPAN
ncbi:MAG: hypothetical protein HYZ11_03820 [Candidatus Tectomicrobia bacterium]|uniref:Uncharacterized protein n=1 Tax=Tectimicrobiota bacterium TaxID=2528274 RepID=A0A932HX98_UNCTE|nr:hypothetical protein [Candidatus Tectomicrobia bacterium]